MKCMLPILNKARWMWHWMAITMESIRGDIWLFDDNGRFIFAHHDYLQQTSQSPVQPTGPQLGHFFQGDNAKQIIQHFYISCLIFSTGPYNCLFHCFPCMPTTSRLHLTIIIVPHHLCFRSVWVMLRGDMTLCPHWSGTHVSYSRYRKMYWRDVNLYPNQTVWRQWNYPDPYCTVEALMRCWWKSDVFAVRYTGANIQCWPTPHQRPNCPLRP